MTSPLEAGNLAPLQELMDRATPGPWGVFNRGDLFQSEHINSQQIADFFCTQFMGEEHQPELSVQEKEVNARLAVAAVNALPHLIAYDKAKWLLESFGESTDALEWEEEMQEAYTNLINALNGDKT